MGYESTERDSLITLKYALEFAMKKLGSKGGCNSQMYKDVNYELGRVNVRLME